MKKLLAFLVTLYFTQQAYTQTIYHLHYNQQIENVSVPTYALFFQHEDGSGFLRTRYTDPVSKADMLLEMSLTEEAIEDSNQQADTSKMYILTVNPELILGNVKAIRNTPVFLFELNQNSGEMEMSSILYENKKGAKIVDEKASLNVAYVNESNLTKELFANYFQEGDDFLENYFSPNSKDISAAEKNITMHMLIVADTLEKNIGRSCAFDMRRVMQMFAYIAAYIGCKTNIRIVAGKDYGKRSVVSELKLLKAGSNDIIVFYYTGHGYRRAEDTRRYPYLDLRSKPDDDYLRETLNMEDIYKQIKLKGARTNLVLSDCCNTYVEATNATGSKPIKKKSIVPELNSQFVRSLFLNKISVLATAADSTQKASGNPSFGGFFSYFLKTSVENSCSKNVFANKARESGTAPTWYDILNQAQQLTYNKSRLTYCDKPFIPENICNQSPCFRIER
jgi:hypothetical protein